MRRLHHLLLGALLVLLLTTSTGIATAQTEVQASTNAKWDRRKWGSLCAANIAQSVRCPSNKPICCSRASAVRCCPLPASAAQNPVDIVINDTMCSDTCTEEKVLGFEFSRVSVGVSMTILFILLFFGTMVSSAMGKYSAYVFERHALIRIIRQRRREEREASKTFHRQLQEFEQHEQDPEARAEGSEDTLCVICYVRQVDVGVGPCGHVAVCQYCCQRLKECPVCREVVKAVYALPPALVQRLAGDRRQPQPQREGEMVEMVEEGSGASPVHSPTTPRLVPIPTATAAGAGAGLLHRGGSHRYSKVHSDVPSSPSAC